MRLGNGSSLFAAALLALLAAPASADNRGIPFEPGNLLTGQISPGEAEDTFVFDGLAGSFFDAAVAGDKTGGLSPMIALFAPDGEAIDLTGRLKAEGAKAAKATVSATDPEPRVTSLSTDTAQRYDDVTVYGSEDVLPGPSNHGLHAVVTADYARGAPIVVHLRSGDRVIVSK
jgi:hypothetical protein